MKKRCDDPRHKKYKYYGGKGISVCEEWKKSFSNFYNWAKKNGYRDDLFIDRVDNDGNYCPENCRFTTWEVQLKNRKKYDKKKK
jgi:hypothetical protein